MIYEQLAQTSKQKNQEESRPRPWSSFPLAVTLHFLGKGKDIKRYWPENITLKTLCVCMARDRNTGWRGPGGKWYCCNTKLSAKTKGAAKPKQIASLNHISF